MKKYSIRRYGHTSWNDTEKIEDAIKDCDYANRNIAKGHVIIDNENGEVVNYDDIHNNN